MTVSTSSKKKSMMFQLHWKLKDVHNTKNDGYTPHSQNDSAFKCQDRFTESTHKKKKNRTINPNFEIMFAPRYQNDDGDITRIKVTNLRPESK